MRSTRTRSSAVASGHSLRPDGGSRSHHTIPERTSRRHAPGADLLSVVIAALALLLTLAVPNPSVAQNSDGRTPGAQSDTDQCQTEYEKARELYFSAEFEPAIGLLETCLDAATLRDTTKARMYRMLAFSYLGSGDEAKARLAVENLLDNDSDYKPDPVQDRPDFVRLIQNVREEREQLASSDENGRGWVKWVVGAATVVTLGVLAAVLSGGSGGGGNGGEIDD